MKFCILFILLSFFLKSNSSEPERVIELGEGWAGNTLNTVNFRHHGIVTFGKFQFTAFFKDRENLILIKRDLTTNEWFSDTLKGNYNVYDAHNSISMGIDKDGYIHISYDHHGDELRYLVSKIPLDITSWSEPLKMTGEKERKVTYPTFMMNPMDSTLLFLHRDGSARNGQACMKIYDTNSKRWSDFPECIISGRNQKPWTSNPYWNHPVFDRSGNLHISYVWRTQSVSSNELTLINNIGIDYTFSPDNGGSWFTTKGFLAPLPITQVNSETVWAVPVGTNLINQTSMAVDSNDNPHIVYYANDENDIPQYQHLWYDGKKWNNNVISNRKEGFNLSGRGTLQIPISRPEIVIDRQNNVYIIFRADFTGDKMSVMALSPPSYEFDEANIRFLWSNPLGYSEPIIDRIRWQRDNILSMLLQYNNQPDGDRIIIEEFSPVFIFDWNLNSFFMK